MVGFLQKIYQALDDNLNEQNTALYARFWEAFDEVPHFEPMKKIAEIGVGGCLLEVLANCLNGRKQLVRADNVSSKTLDITSGVPQGSLLVPLLFCILVNDLPVVAKFDDPFPFTNDFKVLAHEALRQRLNLAWNTLHDGWKKTRCSWPQISNLN